MPSCLFGKRCDLVDAVGGGICQFTPRPTEISTQIFDLIQRIRAALPIASEWTHLANQDLFEDDSGSARKLPAEQEAESRGPSCCTLFRQTLETGIRIDRARLCRSHYGSGRGEHRRTESLAFYAALSNRRQAGRS